MGNTYYDVALLVDASEYQRWLRRVAGIDNGDDMLKEASYMKKYEIQTNRDIMASAKEMASAVLLRNGDAEYVLSQEKTLAAMVLAEALFLLRSAETSFALEKEFVDAMVRPLFDTEWASIFHTRN